MAASAFVFPTSMCQSPKMTPVKAPQTLYRSFIGPGEWKNINSASMTKMLDQIPCWQSLGEAVNGVKLSSIYLRDSYLDLSGSKPVYLIEDGDAIRPMESSAKTYTDRFGENTMVTFSKEIRIKRSILPDKKYKINIIMINGRSNPRMDDGGSVTYSYKYYITVDDKNGNRVFKQKINEVSNQGYQVELDGHAFEIAANPMTLNKKPKEPAGVWDVLVQRMGGFLPFSLIDINDEYEVHMMENDSDHMLASTKWLNDRAHKTTINGYEITVGELNRGVRSGTEIMGNCMFAIGPTYQLTIKNIRTGRTESYSVPADSPARIQIGKTTVGLYAKKPA